MNNVSHPFLRPSLAARLRGQTHLEGKPEAELHVVPLHSLFHALQQYCDDQSTFRRLRLRGLPTLEQHIYLFSRLSTDVGYART
jgi:hypothetical protein